MMDDIIDKNLNKNTDLPPKSGSSQRSKNGNPLDSLLFDPQTGPALQRLETVKSQAISNEQYDTCIQIKNIQNFLSDLAPKFSKLDSQKTVALQQEDYAQAKAIKLQQDELRLLALQK